MKQLIFIISCMFVFSSCITNKRTNFGSVNSQLNWLGEGFITLKKNQFKNGLVSKPLSDFNFIPSEQYLVKEYSILHLPTANFLVNNSDGTATHYANSQVQDIYILVKSPPGFHFESGTYLHVYVMGRSLEKKFPEITKVLANVVADDKQNMCFSEGDLYDEAVTP